MLKQMRSQAKNLKFVFWLILASFLVSFVFLLQGGAGGIQSNSGEFAAKVGDRTVTTQDFRGALERQDSMLRQRYGDAYDQDQLDGIAVLDSLVERNLMLEEADRLGVVITPGQVADHLRSMKALQDEQGRLDRERYQDVLSVMRMRPAEFEAQLADDLRIQQLEDIVADGAVLTDTDVEREWMRENDSAQISYVVVPLSEFEATVTVTDDEAKAWFDSHLADFDAGEAKQVQWVRFSGKERQEALENEDEMRKYYDENVDAMFTIGEEQRRASLILVSIPKDMDDYEKNKARDRASRAATGARTGSDFAVLVGGWSDDLQTNDKGGDLGPLDKGQLDPEVEKAVWAASEGDVVGPIETDRGLEILKVTKGAGRKARPYDEVRYLVSRGLYARQAADAVKASVEKFQAARAGGADFAASASAAGARVEGPAWLPRGGALPGVAADPRLAAEAFRLGVGGISEPLDLVDGQLVLTVLAERDSSARTFEAAKADVETALKASKARDAAKAAAEKLRDDAVHAEALQRAAGTRPVLSAGPFRREGPIPGLPNAPDVLRAVFETRIGEIGRVADAADGAVVFFVNSRRRPEQSRFEGEKKEYGEMKRAIRVASLRQDLLSKLRQEHADRITINESVLAPYRKPVGG